MFPFCKIQKMLTLLKVQYVCLIYSFKKSENLLFNQKNVGLKMQDYHKQETKCVLLCLNV